VAAAAVVGNYTVALAVAQIGLLLPRALSSVVLPRIATLHASEAVGEREMVESKSMRHGALLALGTGLLLCAAALVLPLVYGKDFTEARTLLLLLTPGTVALGLSAVLVATLLGHGRPHDLLVVSLISTPLALILYGLMIPPWEGEGAAIASSIAYIFGAVLIWRRYARVIGIGSATALIPRRDDLADYRALIARARARLRARRD
jgi:O-antigen/teichoic acid export membrane protein